MKERWIYPMATCAALLMAGCNLDGTGNGHKVSLEIEGAGGSKAYFERFVNNKAIVVDSAALDAAGHGVLRLPALPLDFYRIRIGEEHLVVVLDSTEDLKVEAKVGGLATPPVLEGSKHTELLHRFHKDDGTFSAKRDSLRRVIALDAGNTEAINTLNQLNSAFYESCKSFVAENSASPVALTAINKLNMQQEFALYKKVRDDLRKPMGGSGYYTAFREQVDRTEQQEIAMRMQEEEMQRLAGLLPIGGDAPEIRQQTPDGGTFALSEMRGKVVLIDFWASWCRPCRIENPAMKRVHAKYKDKGFDILGVALDRDHNAWVQAIQADGLPWKHVSDLGFWNNAAAQEYGVSSIPFTVLVDREGKILAKGLRSHDLDAKLAELFGS